MNDFVLLVGSGFMAKEYLRDVITEPEVMEAFKVFDKDGYGTVNINELRYVLEYLARTNMIDHEEVDECLEYFDADNNGLINFKLGLLIKISTFLKS